MITKKIAEYMQNNKDKFWGCKFIGLDVDTGEVFVAFPDDDSEKISENQADRHVVTARALRKEFPDITKVIVMETMDFRKAHQLLDELNTTIQDLEKESENNLLQIGNVDGK